MITFLYVLYVLVCIFLILVVLLQAGRGGMGAAFGGGSSQTVFGGSGAGNFLTRLTVIMAALFMILSASLTYVSSSGEQSLERAEKLLREKEAARKAATAGSGKAAPAPAPAEQSSPDSVPAAPVEGEEAAPAEVGGAVDDALKALDDSAPAQGAAEPSQEPAPSAPAN